MTSYFQCPRYHPYAIGTLIMESIWDQCGYRDLGLDSNEKGQLKLNSFLPSFFPLPGTVTVLFASICLGNKKVKN